MTATSTHRATAGLGPMTGLVLCCLCVPADSQATDPRQPATPPPASGNFLSRVPIESLAATRERPLFSPTRRGPPQQAVAVDRPIVEPVRSDEAPHLTLLGIIRSTDGGASVILQDDSDHTAVNLKLGDNRRGWVVQSIDGPGVVLRKAQLSATLKFPVAQRPGLPATPSDD